MTEIRAVALDVDGTLAGVDHQVSARALAVLAGLERLGVHAVVVTGRTEHAARGISQAAGLASPVISCNGAIITAADGERLRVASFERSVVEGIRDFGARHGVASVVWTPSAMHASAASASTGLLEAINGEPVTVGEPPSERVVKVMLGGPESRLDELEFEVSRSLPMLQRSMSTFFEASPPGADKWESLRFVLDGLGVAPSECLGFGDGDTDRAWLTQIGEAVAVSNARPAVLEVASTVIGHHADDSVADHLAERFAIQL